MLALCRLQACIGPKRGSYTRASNGIMRSRSVSGICATPAPAGFECEPGAAGHWLEVIFLCLLVFLLPFLQHSELLLLLIGALFPFVQLAGFRFDLAATTRAVEVRYRFISRVHLPGAFPAVARKNLLLVIDRLELWE